jgi:hypothetical protein
VGRAPLADDVLGTMRAAGFLVAEQNPFARFVADAIQTEPPAPSP